MRGMDITNVYGSVLCLGRFGVCPGSRRTGFGVGMTPARLPGLDSGMGKSGYKEHIDRKQDNR